jgi:hypothetical protein
LEQRGSGIYIQTEPTARVCGIVGINNGSGAVVKIYFKVAARSHHLKVVGGIHCDYCIMGGDQFIWEREKFNEAAAFGGVNIHAVRTR